jgi:hypothetical protein
MDVRIRTYVSHTGAPVVSTDVRRIEWRKLRWIGQTYRTFWKIRSAPVIITKFGRRILKGRQNHYWTDDWGRAHLWNVGLLRDYMTVFHRNFPSSVYLHLWILNMLKAKTLPLHATKTLGGEEVYHLLILDLGTRWGWVVSVTPGCALASQKGPRYPLYRRLGEPQSLSGHSD